MKPKRELKDVLRDIQNLDLQRMNGTVKQRDYERRRSALDAEWKSPGVPREYTGIDYASGLVTSINVTSDSSGRIYAEDWVDYSATGALSESDWQKLRNGYFNDARGYYSSGYFGSKDYSKLAQTVWDECEGIVLCECESMDCLRRIDITKDEYIKASSPGNARLTHPECSYGIVNSKLLHRTPKWNIWWKGDQPGW